MIVTQRFGKFKTRVEIDWNDFDPFRLEEWCKKNFKYKEEWISRGIRNADYDYNWYFYFKNLEDATMFMLKWG